MKAKGQIQLRKRKLKNGGYSLYLDIYNRGVRAYEYLHLYLQEERTPDDRFQNKETLRVAESMRAMRMIDLQRGASGLVVASDKKVSELIEEYLLTKRRKTIGTEKLWRYWYNRLQGWKGLDFPLSALDRRWWDEYMDYVESRHLHPTTSSYYLQRMKAVLNYGVQSGYLFSSPSGGVRIPAIQRAERVYLTAEELRSMKEHRKGGRFDNRERAFLFSCLTGLRFSDVKNLRWEEVSGNRITFRQRKTKNLQYLDLNAQAVEYMGERGEGLVFPNLNKGQVYDYVPRWAKEAGISKHISYHTSRHTFAVLMLSAGVDIFTVSKLMGHQSVTTTQVYSDVIDTRRKEAVSKLPTI